MCSYIRLLHHQPKTPYKLEIHDFKLSQIFLNWISPTWRGYGLKIFYFDHYFQTEQEKASLRYVADGNFYPQMTGGS